MFSIICSYTKYFVFIASDHSILTRIIHVFSNLKHYNPTTKEQVLTNHERENELGRVTRKRRKRNVVDDEGGGYREVEQIRNDKTNKYQKLASELYTQNSSHNDREEKATNHAGRQHERHFLSNVLLRDNVFRPPYDYTNFDMKESGLYSGQQRTPPLTYERNVDFLKSRTSNLSPKFVAKWSCKRVAYFVSSLPGICYNRDVTSLNGVENAEGKY